jgi:hypothetical protein
MEELRMEFAHEHRADPTAATLTAKVNVTRAELMASRSTVGEL